LDDRKAVLLSRPFLGLETKSEILDFRSRDRDRDLDKMNSSALESRDHDLEITTLQEGHPGYRNFHPNNSLFLSFGIVEKEFGILFGDGIGPDLERLRKKMAAQTEAESSGYNSESTAIRPTFDSHSTAVRPCYDYSTLRPPVLGCCTAG